MTDVEAHEADTPTIDGPLTEVHTGGDLALRVKVSHASRVSAPGPVVGAAADAADVPKENALVSVDRAEVEAAPAEIPAGCNMALKVTVTCTSTCNLQGGIVRIAGEDGPLVERIAVVSFDGAANKTDTYVVTAPVELGLHTWTAIFAAHEKAGLLHQEASAPFSFLVKSHSTSMAIWDVPTPITIGARFRAKVGVQCSGECNLAGREVVIYDQAGTKMATGSLGDLRWSETGALYWAEVEIEAPGVEGCFEWEARFPKPDLELPHEGTSYSLAFRTAGRPEHTVTVEVLDKETNTPIPHAEVIVHPYRTDTDEHGVARLVVPKGDFSLYVTAKGKIYYRTTIQVAGDVALTAELLPAPFSDED